MAADLDREVGETLDMPKLSAEGDELFVRKRVGITLDYSVVLFQRAGSRWQRVATLPIAIGGQDHLGVPSRRAGGRRLVMYAGGAIGELHEYEETATTWQLVNTYTRAAFSLESFGEPQITAMVCASYSMATHRVASSETSS